MNLSDRPRRLRRSPAMRRLVRETRLSADALVLPLFIREGVNVREPVPSLPGIDRYSPDRLPEALDAAAEAGVNSFLLFGIPNRKDAEGSGAWAYDGVVQQGIRAIRRHRPDALVVTDVCLCEYTSHGHCGVLRDDSVDNDPTLPILARAALSHARAGADVVAPSDMMDGRVAAIRSLLDEEGFTEIPVMSYAVKYASAFYGPFREAAGSAPGKGDRRGYQMDWHNRREAVREAELDLGEHADMLIVKPALSCLDIISDIAAMSPVPVAAYSVSGEYAMIKAAGQNGWIDEYGVLCESAVATFRAGADIYITYSANELAQAIRKGDIG